MEPAVRLVRLEVKYPSSTLSEFGTPETLLLNPAMVGAVLEGPREGWTCIAFVPGFQVGRNDCCFVKIPPLELAAKLDGQR